VIMCSDIIEEITDHNQ